jgi:hypothetical protein
MERKIIALVFGFLILAILGAGVKDMISNRSVSNDYEKIDKIFQSLPETGFQSDRYMIGNYYGGERITLPSSQKSISLFLDTPGEYKEDGEANLKKFAELYHGLTPFCFISQKGYPYSSDVVNIYFNNKPFSREELYRCSPGKAQLVMSAVDLGNNSFLIKHRAYDFHAEESAVFMNGQIIFKHLLIDGEIPLSAQRLKIWGDKIIFKLGQETGEKKGYITFIPKTKKLVFTDIKVFPFPE